MTWTEWFTLLIAVVGAVLGILNTVRDVLRDRVRLKVIPKTAVVHLGAGSRTQTCLAIEVVNLSTFPVTVDEVGFTLRGTKTRKVVQPKIVDGGDWPRRLEPHESVTAYASAHQDHSWLSEVKAAFASTPSGEVTTGTSDRLKWMIQHGRLPDTTHQLTGHPGAVLSTDWPEDVEENRRSR